MRALDPRLLRYASRVRVYLIVLVVATVAIAGVIIVQAQLLATAITGAFTDGLTLSSLRGTVIGLIVVIACRVALVWGVESFSYRASAAVKAQLRGAVLRHVVELGPRWLTGRRTGGLATLVTVGVDSLDAYFARYLPQVALAVVVPAMVVVRLVIADPLAGVTIAITLPLIPLFMSLVGSTTAARTRDRWQALSRLSYHFLDVVAGLPTLKVFGRARAQTESVGRVTDSYRRATVATLRLTFLSSMVLELVATFSVALVAVGVGLRLVGGHLDLWTGLLVLVLAPEAYLPLRRLANHYHAAADGLAAAEDVFDVLETPVPAGPHLAVTTSTAARQRFGPPAPTGLRVEDVRVQHPGRPDPTPDGACLRVRRGEVVALAGPSGSGKSTLIDVLLGFVTPDAGRVVVEEAGGEWRLDDLEMADWRACTAWVPQEPVLQAGTVASNIRLGRPDAPDDAVRWAALAAALREVRLDRPVGEGGRGLSSGQRRRVAMARAVLARRPVLLLDEPTAGLDARTEAQVLGTVRELARWGSAVLMVAHRPAVLSAADRVVVLPQAGPVVPVRADA
ncbi:MAG TPA: thiol reductant ABC exporter subunit CydD [Pseudonocardiaceae bacterium]|nr:thiol reductant ABC exporter subunit CydD [Pseudonocardiaceae bacterium]